MRPTEVEGLISFGEKWPRDLPIRQQIIRLYRPYFRELLLLGAAAALVGLLTGSSQVTLTPLLDLVLSGGEISLDLEGPLDTPSLDLNEIGSYLLNVAARVTGLTNPFPLMIFTSVFYLVIAISVQALAFGLRVWEANLHYYTLRDISSSLFRHVLHMPLSYINTHQSGWIRERIHQDIQIATRDLLKLLIDGVASTTTSLFYLILLISTDVRLTMVAALAGSLHILVTRALSEKVKINIQKNLEIGAILGGFLIERLATVREVKAFTAEAVETQIVYDRYTLYARQRTIVENYRNVEKPIRWTVNRTVIVVVMLFGVWLLLNNELTITGFGLFMFFAQSLIGPLSVLAGLFVRAAGVEGAMVEVLKVAAEPTESNGVISPPEKLERSIEFKDVSFSYIDEPVLQGINLTIQAGEMVALVGQSGAGKSTIADLLMRFYEPDSGSILLDGVPLQDFDLAQYRRLFGVVSQDATLLDDTVSNNISYARPELTQEEVEEAARIANAEPFILRDLPEGYDTVLGERGVRLSGGQRQRIAIARAVAHKPSLLILDEATSALDTTSERLVQKAIDEVVRGNTAVVIAHRLSTIRRADKIVVLDQGKIVEQGTHDELLAKQGVYHKLHQQQFLEEPLSTLPTH